MLILQECEIEKKVSKIPLTIQVCKEDLAQCQKLFLGRHVRCTKAIILGPDFSKQIQIKQFLKKFTY